MTNNEEDILDWMHNSWEFCEDPFLEAAEYAGDSLDLQHQVCNLFKAWINNEDNLRLTVGLKYHTDPELYEKMMLELIRRKLAIK